MTELLPLIDELRNLLVDSLNLEDTNPADIGEDMPLFGDGLDLDSLDALQLAVAVEEKYGVRVAEEDGPKVFRSVRALAEHIAAERGA